ncbi:MAG: hypothetical protein CMO81_08745 [Waddliaceae bacterium]|nr:hypothetical protein [Waddliaceae bacterium]
MGGKHTWKITLHYHRCGECGYIIESRKDYEVLLGEYVKELQCKRCGHRFTAKKAKPKTFGPLWGEE